MFGFLMSTVLFPLRIVAAFLKPVTDAADMLLRPVINRILAKTGISNNVGFFDGYFASNEDPLLRGDLPAAAEKEWPRDKHPTFYRRIPDDLRKPVIVDGRIRGSSRMPIDVLPPVGITQDLVNESKKVAAWAGLKWFIIALIVGLGMSWFTAFSPLAGFALPEWVRPAGVDFWSASEMEWQMKTDQAVTWTLYLGQLLAVLTVGLIVTTWTSAVLAVSLGFSVFWSSWRKLIFRAADEHAEVIRAEAKEATVRWKQRFEMRELEESAYIAQLDEVDRVQSPTIEIGEATGLFNFRGSLTGPRQKTKIKLALEDLFQNSVVMGGTGSGKTFAAMEPVAAQLIQMQDQRDISLYVTDSKGVLWQDIKRIADRLGKGDRVQVIGVGEGEKGIDILDGLEPGFAADVIKSVMRQMGGTAGDSFWPDLAHNMCVHVLKVLRAWERTPAGEQFVAEKGERPYSLVHLYETAMKAKDQSDDSLIAKIKADIIGTLEAEPEKLSDVASVDLFASLDYLRVTWPTMAADTRSGIEANITNALGLFASNMALRKQFASGENSDLTIDDMWGRKITLVNLPRSLGNAGRIVNVMLKSLLFNRAMERQAADPKIRDKQQLGFLADEFQSLITADISAGFTDSSFPNECRSTGLFYFVATQGIRALQQAVGEDSALNFMNNMRNKIFLQIEEQATMAYAQQLAGKALRFLVFDNADHESVEAMRRETGQDPALLGSAILTKDVKKTAGIWALFSAWARFEFAGMRSRFDSSDVQSVAARVARTLMLLEIPNPQAENDRASQDRADANRREDKRADWMKTGNEAQDILSTSDLMQMGRTHAYMCITRGGHLRQDLIKLRGAEALGLF